MTDLDELMLGESPFYEDIKKYTCPAYIPMRGIESGVYELLPYGVCDSDKKIVNCKSKKYEDCEVFLQYLKENPT